MQRVLLYLVLVGLPCRGLAQSTATRVVGQVTAAESSQPIAGVAITLGGITVTTNARGAFAITPAPSGQHQIRFSLLGYESRADTVTIADGQTTDLSVRLSQRPIALPPILATVRSRWLEMNGYYERRFQSGLSGRFIDRTEIERRNPTFLTDLFRDVSGARVEQGFSRRVIRFNREAAGGLLGARLPPNAEPIERWLVSLRGCQPVVYVDGRPHYDRIIRDHGNFVDDFNMLSPLVVEAIEVYVGANTPTEFPTRNNDGCGVLLIWTKKG